MDGTCAKRAGRHDADDAAERTGALTLFSRDMITPDGHGKGFTKTVLDPLRYGGQNDDPSESSGILRRYMPSHVRVLDVGCGVGTVTKIVNGGKNNEVIGIEPDPDRAATAKAEGLNVVCGILDEAFFVEHGTFDVIVFADVLEHLVDPAGMLALASKGLRPNGRILISVPNVAHWSMRWYILLGRFNYTDTGIRDATHLRWFTHKTLRQLLDSCGFEIEQMQQSAGTFLMEYYRMPWKLIPAFVRFRLIRRATRWTPYLFGCQHVVMARRKG
jgi:methionine biosynthesis protein MetW